MAKKITGILLVLTILILKPVYAEEGYVEEEKIRVYIAKVIEANQDIRRVSVSNYSEITYMPTSGGVIKNSKSKEEINFDLDNKAMSRVLSTKYNQGEIKISESKLENYYVGKNHFIKIGDIDNYTLEHTTSNTLNGILERMSWEQLLETVSKSSIRGVSLREEGPYIVIEFDDYDNVGLAIGKFQMEVPYTSVNAFGEGQASFYFSKDTDRLELIEVHYKEKPEDTFSRIKTMYGEIQKLDMLIDYSYDKEIIIPEKVLDLPEQNNRAGEILYDNKTSSTQKISKIKNLIKKDKFYRGYVYLAKLYESVGDLNQALNSIEQYIYYFPEDTYGIRIKTQYLIEMGNIQQATETLHNYLRDFGFNDIIYIDLMDIYASRQDKASLEKYLKKWEKIQPNNNYITIIKAYNFYKEGHLKPILDMAKERPFRDEYRHQAEYVLISYLEPYLKTTSKYNMSLEHIEELLSSLEGLEISDEYLINLFSIMSRWDRQSVEWGIQNYFTDHQGKNSQAAKKIQAMFKESELVSIKKILEQQYLFTPDLNKASLFMGEKKEYLGEQDILALMTAYKNDQDHYSSVKSIFEMNKGMYLTIIDKRITNKEGMYYLVQNPSDEILNSTSEELYVDVDTVEYDVFEMLLELLEKNQFEREIKKETLVLDLRDVDDMRYHSAIGILDALLPEGEMLNLIDNQGRIIAHNSKSFYYPFENIKIYVNENTAGAAEMVAASLKSNLSNVTIYGQQTAGKGVLTDYYINNARDTVIFYPRYYWIVNGKNYSGEGIIPDIKGIQ